jgi:hypothetical protein
VNRHEMLTIAQSERLLRAIFPAYPVLRPQNPVPQRELWATEGRDAGEGSIAGRLATKTSA